MSLSKIVAVVAAAALAGGVVGYWLGAGKADERARIANAEATIAADQLVAVQALADEALEAHRLAVIELDTIAEGRKRAELRLAAIRKQRVPLPSVVPDTCQPFAKEITRLGLEVMDLTEIIKADSATIRVLRADNEQLAESLVKVSSSLVTAEAALREQAKRTETAPKRKLFGVIPPPDIVVGYGFTHSDQKVSSGPQVTLGWRVSI